MTLFHGHAGRLLMIAGLGAFSMGAPAAADDWVTTGPGDVGLDPAIGALIDEAVAQGDLPDLHAGLVARHGKLVVEQ